MDQMLKCPNCNTSYNTDSHSPRILPCDQQLCLACIEACRQPLDGYLIKCDCKQKIHNVNKLEDMPVSQATLFCMNKASHKYMLEQAKFDISQHYDDMEMKIDIRAETLIELVHDYRESLHAEIKAHRKATNDQMETYESKYNADYERLDHLTSQSTPLLANSSHLGQIFEGFLKLQRTVDSLKTKSWYFVENSSVLDKSLLGYNFNSSLDRNYYKIKNMKTLIGDKKKSHQINLKSEFTETKLRHFIMPLKRNRTIGCYFSKSKSVYLELFDSNGQSVKTLEVAADVTYFPLVSCHSEYIVVYYTAKPKLRHPADAFDDSSIGHVALYDSDLNLVNVISEKAIIESVFINESNVICTFAHRSFECCKVFDFKLNHVTSFGQQKNQEESFYMEKIEVNAKQFGKEKVNPVVFGWSKENIYFYTKKYMAIMCRTKGTVWKQIDKMNEKSVFILDSQSNVIEIYVLGNRVRFHNFHLDITVDSVYDPNFDSVNLVEDQYLAFVSTNKDTVTFI